MKVCEGSHVVGQPFQVDFTCPCSLAFAILQSDAAFDIDMIRATSYPGRLVVRHFVMVWTVSRQGARSYQRECASRETVMRGSIMSGSGRKVGLALFLFGLAVSGFRLPAQTPSGPPKLLPAVDPSVGPVLATPPAPSTKPKLSAKTVALQRPSSSELEREE